MKTPLNITFHRAHFANEKTTKRLMWNDTGLWAQWNERGFYILWRGPKVRKA